MSRAHRKLPISLFLQNFHVLDDKLQERLQAVRAGINEVLMRQVSGDKVDKLNTLLAEQHGLNTVYNLVEELKEELDEGREPAMATDLEQ